MATGREQMLRDLPMILAKAECLRDGEEFFLSDIYGETWNKLEDKHGIDHAFASALRSGELSGFWRVLKPGQGRFEASFPNLYERLAKK